MFSESERWRCQLFRLIFFDIGFDVEQSHRAVECRLGIKLNMPLDFSQAEMYYINFSFALTHRRIRANFVTPFDLVPTPHIFNE